MTTTPSLERVENLVRLNLTPGIGPVTAKRLLDMAQETLDEALAETADSVGGEE